MPVNVGKLIAEEFIVHLLRVIDLGQGLGDPTDFFHQLNPFRRSQMKQLRGVAFEDDDGPAGKELILMQIGLGEAEVCNEMICIRPAALAGLARKICHGWFALRHSSSVTTPYLDQQLNQLADGIGVGCLPDGEKCLVSTGLSITKIVGLSEFFWAGDYLDSLFPRTLFSPQ
jgi:hypothetical protein